MLTGDWGTCSGCIAPIAQGPELTRSTRRAAQDARLRLQLLSQDEDWGLMLTTGHFCDAASTAKLLHGCADWTSCSFLSEDIANECVTKSRFQLNQIALILRSVSGSVVTNFILTGCDSINLVLVLPFNWLTFWNRRKKGLDNYFLWSIGIIHSKRLV